MCLTFVGVNSPFLGVIEMSVSSVNGEESVRQSATRTVKGVAVSVLATLESHFNVHGAALLLRERERRDARPHVERFTHHFVRGSFVQRPRVLRDLVRQVLHTPPTACNRYDTVQSFVNSWLSYILETFLQFIMEVIADIHWRYKLKQYYYTQRFAGCPHPQLKPLKHNYTQSLTNYQKFLLTPEDADSLQSAKRSLIFFTFYYGGKFSNIFHFK